MTEKKQQPQMPILLTATFLATLGLGIVIPLLPVFVTKFGASGFWVGALFAGYGLSRILSTSSIGKYSEKYGRKWFITGGLAIYTVVSLWYITAGSVYELFIIRFIHGIASAMIGSTAMAYVGDITPEGREGNYQGKLSNAFYLGLGFGPVIGGALYHFAGLDTVFIVMALMACVPCLLCIKYLPENRPEYTQPPSIWKAFKHKRMQSVLYYRFINTFPYSAFMVFIPVLAAEDYHFNTTIIGVIIAIEVLSMGMTQWFFGDIVDRHKKLPFVVAGTLIVSIVTIAMPFVHNILIVGFIAFCIGIGNAVALSAATAVTAIDGRELGQGVVMGAFNTVVSLGITIPPLIFGVILVHYGVDAIFILSGIISLLGMIPFMYLVKRSRKERGLTS